MSAVRPRPRPVCDGRGGSKARMRGGRVSSGAGPMRVASSRYLRSAKYTYSRQDRQRDKERGDEWVGGWRSGLIFICEDCDIQVFSLVCRASVCGVPVRRPRRCVW